MKNSEAEDFIKILNLNYTNRNNDIELFLTVSTTMLLMIENGKGEEIKPLPPIPAEIVLSNPDAAAAILIQGQKVYVYTYRGTGDVAISMSKDVFSKFIDDTNLVMNDK